MSVTHAAPGSVVNLNTFGESKSAAIVIEKQFEVIRLVLESGKTIPDHKVDGPITVQCLSGRCTFTADDQPHQLKPSSWLHLEGGTMHAVESQEDTVLLVTILFPNRN